MTGPPEPEFPPFFIQFQQTCENVALGLVSNRVRVRALIELLEEKGVFASGEYDHRADVVWERDHEALAQELLVAPEAELQPEEPPPPPPAATYERHYAEALGNFVDEAVASRVRLRALIELLEEGAVLAPGEFERKAEAIWDRDYEELALEFYGGRY